MRNALIFLGTLRDSDVSWLVAAGRKVELQKGAQLVRQGVALDAVYLVLDGKFRVTVGDFAVASLSAGEMIGETSFLDGGLPSATVTATEASYALAIDRTRLAARLDRDEGFASRIYHALAITVADRVRATVRRAGGASGDAESAGTETEEISMELLDRTMLAANHLNEIRRRLGSA
jgi:CRP-like cAMP-binding protein